MTILFVLIVVLVAAGAVLGGRRQNSYSEKPRQRKYLLTKNESTMFNRLVESLPDAVVLAQVSFGALLNAKTKAARNRFDRKVADFVVCNRAHQVVAVIELDDSSHHGRESQDAARDQLLTEAGYRVIRYTHIPDVLKVKTDLAALLAPASQANR